MQAGIFLGIIFFVLWGFLYDRHNRKKLLAVAAFLFGTTSVLLGIAPTYATFAFSFTAINISRASQPGIFALIGDYFSPKLRGRIIGLFLSTQPLALALVLFLVPFIEPALSFRYIYLLLGAVGFLFALMIFFWLGEPKRGANEPALVQIRMTGVYLFDWENAKGFFRSPCMLYIYAISFFAIFPWSVNLFWMHRYLTQVWDLPELTINLSFLPANINAGGWVFLRRLSW
jgi:MFS transporter, Spinster family, sphingosine-1-phosphate transporter